MSLHSFPGYKLRERREALGLPLHDAHMAVRVPIEYLSALESGDLSRLPTAAYAGGFLRSYCNFLDLHADYFVEQLYMAQSAQSPLGSRKATPAIAARVTVGVPDFATWAVICGFLALCWIAYASVVAPWVEESQFQVEAGTETISVPTHFEEVP